MRRISVRRDREEVRTVLPLHASLIHELQIRLVHQRRRRQGMVRTLPPQVAAGQPAQLAVDRLHQAAPRRRFSVAPGDEQARDVGGLAMAGQ